MAVTESLEASIVTTMMCHEMGIPRILAKAKNEMHEKILRKVGATRIMYPEVEMGRRVAKYIVADNFADWIELSPKYSLVEMEVPSGWCGKSVRELGVREKYHLNVVGIKNGDEMRVRIDPEAPLQKLERRFTLKKWMRCVYGQAVKQIANARFPATGCKKKGRNLEKIWKRLPEEGGWL